MNLAITGIVNFTNWDDSDYAETGGINSVIKTIIPHLTANKIMLYGITDQRENLFKQKRINANIVIFPVVFIARTSRLPKRLMCFLLGWRLIKYLKSHHIDNIYNHAEEFGFWLTFQNIPYVHHLHTFVNVLDVSDKKIAKLKLLHIIWEKMRVKVIRGAAKIIAVNNDIVSKCKRIIEEKNIIQFPNYIDTKIFSYIDTKLLRAKYNIENKKVLLFIGRISKVKGLKLLVDTMKELNELQCDQWIGLIIGNGEFEDELYKYIDASNLKKNFIFTGSINNQKELNKFYCLSDVFIITSFSESVPLTLLESLSCGTPVVSSDVGISREVIRHNNGFVITSRNSYEFAKKIVEASAFKIKESLLRDPVKYSVENASKLLNRQWENG